MCRIGRKNWMFLGSDRGGETAATCFSILANAKRHRIEPFAYVRDLLVAISSDEVDWNSLLPDVWIAAHPEHFLHYRRDEAEAAARSRRRRRAGRRAMAKQAGRLLGPRISMVPSEQPNCSSSGVTVAGWSSWRRCDWTGSGLIFIGASRSPRGLVREDGAGSLR